MATQFTSFSQLPYEIRRIIWLYCIPSRVIELEVPPQGRLPSHTDVCLSWTAHQNTRPPVVTRVCKESRDIVLGELGLQLDHTECLPSGEFILTRKPWFSPGRDIVTWSSLECVMPYGPDVGGEDSYFIHHARLAQDVLIPAQIIFPFQYLINPMEPSNMSPDIERTEGDAIQSLKDFMVCLKVVQVHMSSKQALASMLSGSTGDGLIQIVDIMDAVKIAKIYEHVDLRTPEDKRIFDLLLDKKTLHHEVEKWKEHALTHWVCQKHGSVRSSAQARADEADNVPDKSYECFRNHPDDDDPRQEPMDALVFNHLYWDRKPPRFDKFILDRADPWIHWMYERAPKFRPVIMFRLCARDCSMLRSNQLRQQIHCGRYPPEYVENTLKKNYENIRKTEAKEELLMAEDSRAIIKRL